MKFYNLTILVEPLAASTLPAMIREIFDRITTDGKEKILCESGDWRGHAVVGAAQASPFPQCLSAAAGRRAVQISLPSKKDLGRKWFQRRLAGPDQQTFRLVAMTDVSMIHLETE